MQHQVLIHDILSINLVLRNGKLHSFLYSFLNSRNVVSLPFYSLVSNPHISKIRKSPSHFWTVTKGKTQVVGLSTFSIMSFSSSTISFSNKFCLRLWEIFLGCTRGGTDLTMWIVKLKSFNFPIPQKMSLHPSIVLSTFPRFFKFVALMFWFELNWIYLFSKKVQSRHIASVLRNCYMFLVYL